MITVCINKPDLNKPQSEWRTCHTSAQNDACYFISSHVDDRDTIVDIAIIFSLNYKKTVTYFTNYTKQVAETLLLSVFHMIKYYRISQVCVSVNNSIGTATQHSINGMIQRAKWEKKCILIFNRLRHQCTVTKFSNIDEVLGLGPCTTRAFL